MKKNNYSNPPKTLHDIHSAARHEHRVRKRNKRKQRYYLKLEKLKQLIE